MMTRSRDPWRWSECAHDEGDLPVHFGVVDASAPLQVDPLSQLVRLLVVHLPPRFFYNFVVSKNSFGNEKK